MAGLISTRIVSAAVTVTNPPPAAPSTCTITGSDGTVAKEIVGVEVMPDGKIYNITGTYTVGVNCSGADCVNLVSAVNSATAQGNSISGFPQATDGASNNSIQIEMGTDNSQCYSGTDGCEWTNVDAVTGATIGHIYINQSALESLGFFNDPSALTSLIEHEMGHAFGLADSPSDEDGLMSFVGPESPQPNWGTDGPVQEAIRELNSGNVTVGNCTDVCAAEHPGSTPVWSPSVPGSYTCQFPACTAAQLAEGWTFDDSTGCQPPTPTQSPSSTSEPTSPACGGNQTYDSSSGQCTCAPGYTANADGSCTEASGTQCPASDPSCSNAPANSCPSGTSAAPDGSCQAIGSGDCVDSATGEDVSCASVCATTDPEPSWCASVPSTPSFCDQNPADPSCPGNSGSDYCDQNPADPDCPNYCSENPDDASCIGSDSGSDSNYCDDYPDSPECGGSDIGGSSGADGGGSECAIYDDASDISMSCTL
ncbi:MAG TPA: hypothetical protein VMA75_04245 [Candidatus Paceibacterota bacterium]|nr:hypothetical protein [Candidatus Paceibacterota bacterium]